MSELHKSLVEKFISNPNNLRMGAGKLSARWRCTPSDIYQAKEEAREILNTQQVAVLTDHIAKLEEHIIEISNENGTLKSVTVSDFDPKTDLELAELHKIDLTKYSISNYWSKLKANGKFTSSVFCKLKKSSEFDAEAFLKFFQTYDPKHIPVSIIPADETKETVDVEISIADFHINRETIKKDTIVDRANEYFKVLDKLINSVARSYTIRKVVFPIGNDFFNSDNYQGTTTNGTPQDNSVRFNTAYEVGFDLLVRAIAKLKVNCSELEVILIQGNHDRTTSYYLAHALGAYFRNVQGVTFNREHSVVKHIVLGRTFIGYHHGNTKIEELPLMFATSPESAPWFGTAKYREVHTADKHHYMVKEIKGSGVRIQQVPSLVNPDRWSTDNNYVNNIRAGLALVYHPEKGKIAEIEERV